ncbi:MAG: hypothetical protein ACREE2_18985 [Stellaceae bacterium]
MADSLRIGDESDLWGVLERMLSYSLAIPLDLFEISGWQPELLYFPDEPLGHSISPSIARAVSGFHASISRSYAYLAYGRPNARLLRNDDIYALDIRILVVAGSDGLTFTEKGIRDLVYKLAEKMTGKQITVAIVVFLLMYFSASVTKDWIDKGLEAKRQEVESSERIKQSEEETKRMALIAKALESHPGLKPVADMSYESKEPLARAVTSTINARISGAPITGEEAKAILSNPRQAGHGKRVDGIYDIVEIDIENPDGYMGRVRNNETHEEFTVSINRRELPDEDIGVLFKALHDKTAVHTLINAWFVGDKITHASIVRANTPGNGGD